MSLDLFNRNLDESVAYAARASAPDLPVDFSHGMSDAWNTGYLTGQSISGQIRQQTARSQLIEDAIAKTGDTSLGQFHGEGGGFDVDGYNQRLAAIKGTRPDLDVQPLSDEAVQARADEIGKGALDEQRRTADREHTTGGRVGSFLGSTGAALTDPVNLIAFPLAAPEALGILGTSMAWAAIGGGSQVAIEALNSTAMERIKPGYSASDEPVTNILAAAGFSGVIGGGLKGLSNAWTRARTGEWPRSIRDAGNVVDSEAQIAETNRFPGVEGEVIHRTALQKAIDDMVNGRPVDVDGIVQGDILRAYDAKTSPIMEQRAKAATAQESAITFERDAARLPPTMERLSEVQLSEFRDVVGQARQDAEAARAAVAADRVAVGAERGGLSQRTAGVTALENNAAGIRTDLERLQQRVADARQPTDPATQARLEAIDSDLSKAIGADARTALERERAQITETLAKTSPEDQRLLASLDAERKGLEKALARAEKAITKGRESIARAEGKLAARETAIPRREQIIAERENAKRDAATNSLRRSVARLAEDGYGIRLPRDDAQVFADRILAASDDEAEAVLRGITEDFVSRAVDLKRAEPPELPGFGKPVPAAEQRARVGYHTEEMRKQITGLAREVGYEMPREEAALIAARISGMSENDALAVLDELLLRPRTLADTLPGTEAAKPASEQVSKINTGSPEALRALADDVTPERIAELRTEPEMADTISRDLDRLRAEKGDFEIPTGVTKDADGNTIAAMRKVEDVMAEVEARELASQELMSCVGPYPKEAAE